MSWSESYKRDFNLARNLNPVPVLLRPSRHITSSSHIKCLSVGQIAHTGMWDGRVLTKITESKDSKQYLSHGVRASESTVLLALALET